MYTSINEFKKYLNESIGEWKAKFGDDVKFEDTQGKNPNITLAYNKNFEVVGKWHKDTNKGEVFEKPTEKYDSYF